MAGLEPARQSHLAVAGLIKTWETVLRRSPIFADDNFFDLGGDPPLAAALCRAIEETTGQNVPVTAIYKAPTVAALAQELERIFPRFESLVLLKDGNAEPPLFMAAGAGGSFIRFLQIAKRVSPDHPVYAIEARRPDAMQPPDNRIEEIAKSVQRTVLGRQPTGPYLLAGHSFGGLLMLEVAQNLIGQGEKVSLLALFDTYPHPHCWPLTPWIAGMTRMIGGRLSAASRMRMTDMLPYLRRQSWNFIDHFRARRTGAELLTTAAQYADWPDWMRVAYERDLVAWSRYRPRYYPGTITFLKADTARGGLWPNDPAAVWGDLVESLDVHTVPGSHLTMLTTHARALGAELSRCIERALAPGRAGPEV
jgi:acetoacetyl-CoA synthetase